MTGIANVGAIKRYENPGARYKSGVPPSLRFSSAPSRSLFRNHTRNHSALSSSRPKLPLGGSSSFLSRLSASLHYCRILNSNGISSVETAKTVARRARFYLFLDIFFYQAAYDLYYGYDENLRDELGAARFYLEA